MSRRRREILLHRRIHVVISEADVLVWGFGLLSLIYCAVTIVVEVARMLG